MNISLSPFVPENLVSRDEFGRPVPPQLNLALPHEIPLDFRGGVHSTYRVNRHRVSVNFIKSRICVKMAFAAESPPGRSINSQGSSSNGCCLCSSPWTNYASLFSHPLYYHWYEAVIAS